MERSVDCLASQHPANITMLSEVLAYFGIAALLFKVIYLIATKLQRKKGKRSTEPGTVVLHQLAPYFFTVVSGCPPCLKLQTFLRIAKIPYENDYRSAKLSKKGKMPWIEFNGQEIADSNFCIRFLEKEFQVDVDSHLSATERAIGHGILTMLEEITYWVLVYTRWLSDYGSSVRMNIMLRNLFQPLNYLVLYKGQRKARHYLWLHGIGRHTEEEMYAIAERDLLSVSRILGDKKFLFGDKPCLADAALFGFIVGATWEYPECPIAEVTKSKAKNLEEHARRMKELYYRDWDKIMSGKPKSE